MFPNFIYAAQESKKGNKKIPEPREKEDNPKHEKMEKKQVNCQKDGCVGPLEISPIVKQTPSKFRSAVRAAG
jgi:hypothetical protein